MNRTISILLAALWLPVTTLALADPGTGDRGIGDPYFPDYGNGGYDVEYYDILVDYDPTTDHIRGVTTILADATQDLTTFNLDFVLHVDSVLVNNRPAKFALEGDHELVIEPATPLLEGESLVIVVRYNDVPSKVVVKDVRTGWVRTADGANVLGEPEVAWWFFPSNDHPLDKATYDITVLVPEGVTAISNGVLKSSRRTETGKFQWIWHSSKPQQTYLTFLAIGQYDLVQSESESGLPVYNAYSKALGEYDGAARASVERTPEIIAWEESLFGPYPFEAMGGVVLPPDGEQGFSLETQTRPNYAQGFFEGGANPGLIVHENAHQWFGDSVAVAHWSDVWLNEGFATYAEWLWSDHEGEGTPQAIFDYYYERIPEDDEFWDIVVTDPGPGFENLFAGPIYVRGAMALQQLRVAVGDEAFFKLLKTWAKTKQYSNGTTEEFQALAEEISKCDVSGLFEAWLSTPGRPKHPLSSELVADSGKAMYSPAPKPRPASIDKLDALLRFKH